MGLTHARPIKVLSFSPSIAPPLAPCLFPFNLACFSSSILRESAELLQGSVAPMSEHRQLRLEALGLIPSGCPCIFPFSSDLPAVAYIPPVQLLLSGIVIKNNYVSHHAHINVSRDTVTTLNIAVWVRVYTQNRARSIPYRLVRSPPSQL